MPVATDGVALDLTSSEKDGLPDRLFRKCVCNQLVPDLSSNNRHSLRRLVRPNDRERRLMIRARNQGQLSRIPCNTSASVRAFAVPILAVPLLLLRVPLTGRERST